MHRTRYRARPVLFLLVFGVFLVLIGVTASAQAVLVSEHFTSSMLNAVVGTDAATIRTFVNGNLTEADLLSAPDGERRDALEHQLVALTERGEILRAELRSPTGTVLLSSDPTSTGRSAAVSAELNQALAGEAIVRLESDPAHFDLAIGSLPTDAVFREYLPMISGDRVRGVFVVWRDAAPVLAQLEATRRDIVLVTLAAALIASAILILVFRSAQTRITRQTRELLEAARRDALTGMLNHGSIVAVLNEAIEDARLTDAPVGVAIVDLDNFRLLNDTHGHAGGDQALLTVARLLEQRLPAEVTCGRFGPDEFLLLASGRHAAVIEHSLQQITHALVDVSLTFGASERLPITLSAGVAYYPEHADSATALLSTAALTVAEARASGGNAVRVANARLGETANQSTFDVYQGLIIAVDTKDRYTKRHSEDVARYAMFLADQIGADEQTRQTLRVAALLHDVGKIGIPDGILRKPGTLTESEREIIRQHVALGDAIVRNLPNIDLVRAGIRHHHEQWDGRGYLDGLAGAEIPLIARIIAVGDTFSAMTTSRPYRKALPIEEALKRLGDAAGSQLEEGLVAAFIRGMETAANPPLPGEELPAARLWTPARAVA